MDSIPYPPRGSWHKTGFPLSFLSSFRKHAENNLHVQLSFQVLHRPTPIGTMVQPTGDPIPQPTCDNGDAS
jgi:hypothetical protein